MRQCVVLTQVCWTLQQIIKLKKICCVTIKDGSTVRYGTKVRYGTHRNLLKSTVRLYVRFFRQGTGPILWYALWTSVLVRKNVPYQAGTVRNFVCNLLRRYVSYLHGKIGCSTSLNCKWVNECELVHYGRVWTNKAVRYLAFYCKLEVSIQK